jgi:hypothetical protein
MRVGLTLCFALLFGITMAVQRAGTSYMSHVGGFLFGLLLASLLLPAAGCWRRRWWWWGLRIGGGALLAASVISTATVFYVRILPSVCCGCTK